MENQGDTFDGPLSAVRALNFSPADADGFRAAYEGRALFVKVFLLPVPVGPERLANHLRWAWRIEGTMDVVPLEHEFFLLKFSDPSDCEKALAGAPWMIFDHYLTLHPWVPNFKPSKAVITRTPVWVRLPELPIEYYEKATLLRIIAEIGKRVKIDPITESASKCKFARFCVEIDLTSPLPVQISLAGGLWQVIQYEGLHIVCYGCGRVGHFQQDCSHVLPAAAGSSSANMWGPGIHVRRGRIHVLEPSSHLLLDLNPSTSSYLITDTQASPTSPIVIEFYSKGLQLAVQEGEISVNTTQLVEPTSQSRPTISTIDPKVTEIHMVLEISGTQHVISFNPTLTDLQSEDPVQQSRPRKLLSLNCRAADNSKIIRGVEDLCKQYRPAMVVLFVGRSVAGTAAFGVVNEKLAFSGSKCIGPVGVTSGVWLFWNKNEVNVDVGASITTQESHEIHVNVLILPDMLTDYFAIDQE